MLAQHPAFHQAVVLAREDADGGDKRLVAYVVTEASRPSTKELRGFLKQKLPDYMVPAAFVNLGAMPLSPTASWIAEPCRRRISPSRSGHGFVAPRTPTEDILANIWAEVLELDAVGIHDNFFELGGHSLLATRVVSRIRNALSCNLSLRICSRPRPLPVSPNRFRPAMDRPAFNHGSRHCAATIFRSRFATALMVPRPFGSDRATYNVPQGSGSKASLTSRHWNKASTKSFADMKGCARYSRLP